MLPSLSVMHDIALRFIFDKPSVDKMEIISLEEGIAGWSKKIDLTPWETWDLKRVVNALIAEEHGFWDRSKELQRQHKVDYRKMYNAGLPFINTARTTWNKS